MVDDSGGSAGAIGVHAAGLAPGKARSRPKLGRYASNLDQNPHWQRFRERFPKAHAWALRDRLDKILVPGGIAAQDWATQRAQGLSAGRSLEELWPAPAVLPMANCQDGETDCDPEAPVKYEIASPSETVKRQVRDLLWGHVGMLVEEHPVFNVGTRRLVEESEVVDVQRSNYGFRLLVHRTAAGLPLYGGPQRLEFDSEGRLLAFNKGFITEAEAAKVRGLASRAAKVADVVEQARNHVQNTWEPGRGAGDTPPTTLKRSLRTYEPVRGRVLDVVHLTDDARRGGHVVQIDSETGEIYSDYREEVGYTDARVRRATYSSGNLLNPSTTTSTSIYTRDSNELVHDFFYIMDDRRCENGSLVNCPTCPTNPGTTDRCSRQPLTHCLEAYQTSQDGNIRGTRMPSRDFSVFGTSYATEGHVYYWARNYMQWQRNALSLLGLLPSSVSDYEKATLIVNACRSIAYVDSGDDDMVRTSKSDADASRKIYFRNYPSESDNASDFVFDFVPSGSVIAHEMNHFVMFDYLDFGASKNCGSGDENRNVHEGVLGTLLPQRHWHSRYGVGYNPSPQSRLLWASRESAQVHTNASTLLTRSGQPCSGSDYNAGRVLGQALWKLAWSRDYTDAGGQINIKGITSRDELIATAYFAAMWADNGTIEDFAWAFTAYAYFFLGLLDADDVEDWCNVFDRHEIAGEFGSTCSL